MDNWILLQLSDSALPVGGFVASGGLESAIQILNIKSIDSYLRDSLHNLAFSAIPLIRSAYRSVHNIDELIQLDKEYDAFAGTNHVNRRASVTQGVAYLTLVTKSFPDSMYTELITLFKQKVRLAETPGHLPLCFTLACLSLQISLPDIEFMFLFLHVRSIVSSAIRMSLIGPYEGQSVIFKAQELVKETLEAVKGQQVSDLFQTNPLVDILQGCHDRLYTRIFNS